MLFPSLPGDASTAWVATMGLIVYVIGVSVATLVTALVVEYLIQAVEFLKGFRRLRKS